MTAVVSAISIGVFLIAFWLARVLPTSLQAISIFRDAMAVVNDSALTDEMREKIMQKGSLQLLGVFASIVIRSAIAVGAALLPIYLAEMAGIVAANDVLHFLARWDVIVVATIVIGGASYAYAKIWRKR